MGSLPKTSGRLVACNRGHSMSLHGRDFLFAGNANRCHSTQRATIGWTSNHEPHFSKHRRLQWSQNRRQTGWNRAGCGVVPVGPPAGETSTQADTRHASAAPGRFNRGDVDLLHLHHRFEGALGCRAVRVGDGGHQGARCDLPRQPPLVLAPPARAYLAAIADDRVPPTALSANVWA